MSEHTNEEYIAIIKAMIAEPSGLEYGSRYVAGEGDLEEFEDRIEDYAIDCHGHLCGKETGLSKVGDSKNFGRGHVYIELIFEEKRLSTYEDDYREKDERAMFLARGFILIFQNQAKILYLQTDDYIPEEVADDGSYENARRRDFYNLSTGSRDPSDDDDFDFSEMLDDVDSGPDVADDD
tara:strand:+ start:116 stop:655 length:540 start_codon:yes stop_codon:yes gene_type:complete